nr:hypothetical protein [Tanacetum cinerariifolium]
YDQSTSTDRPIFLNDNEDHPVQNRDALDSKLLSINSINSQRPDKKEQEVKIVEEQPAERRNLAPILSTKEPENSLSMGDGESFEDIEYVEASLSDPEIVSVKEENVVQREEEEVDFEDISQIQDVVLREKLLSITRLISNIESLNDNSTPDRVFNSFESDNSLLDNFRLNSKLFAIIRKRREVNDNSNSSNDPLLEEVDLFLFDNSIPPGIENVADDPKGDIRFLKELLIDDSILSHESFDSSFEDSPSISRPPPEPPDDNFDLEPEDLSPQ